MEGVLEHPILVGLVVDLEIMMMMLEVEEVALGVADEEEAGVEEVVVVMHQSAKSQLQNPQKLKLKKHL